MPSLYSVRIDEVRPGLGEVELIGKKQPLSSLEEVCAFLAEYAQAWKQLPPPPPAEIEAQFEAQRAALAVEDGPPPPGARRCRFTVYPYLGTDEAGDQIEHVISILEMTGKLSALGEEAARGQVLVAVLHKRQCRVCGCTELDCQSCIEKTGAPCHWVATDLCSACEPQQTPLAERQWVLSFAQAAVIERAIAAHNAAEYRRHNEALQLRIVHRNERDYFVYLTIAKGKDVWDEYLFQLGWQAFQLAQQEGGQVNG